MQNPKSWIYPTYWMIYCEKTSGKRANPLKRLRIKKHEFGTNNAYNILYILHMIVRSKIRDHAFLKIGNNKSAR
jgi:hypothetical protein